MHVEAAHACGYEAKNWHVGVFRDVDQPLSLLLLNARRRCHRSVFQSSQDAHSRLDSAQNCEPRPASTPCPRHRPLNNPTIARRNLAEGARTRHPRRRCRCMAMHLHVCSPKLPVGKVLLSPLKPAGLGQQMASHREACRAADKRQQVHISVSNLCAESA